MSIEQLIYFTKVCENKSFTKTSKELFISQPAITTAIKNLEKEFKTELITMNGKNLEITPSGERLYSLAIPIITLYNNLENSNIKLQNKTAVFTREYERKYPDGFFDSLYANFASKNAIATS